MSTNTFTNTLYARVLAEMDHRHVPKDAECEKFAVNKDATAGPADPTEMPEIPDAEKMSAKDYRNARYDLVEWVEEHMGWWVQAKHWHEVSPEGFPESERR